MVIILMMNQTLFSINLDATFHISIILEGMLHDKLDKYMKCKECTWCLLHLSLSKPVSNKLTSLISLGHLVNVSDELFSLVKYTLFKIHKDRPSFDSKHTALKVWMFFKDTPFISHPFYVMPGTEPHGLRLIKRIGTTID